MTWELRWHPFRGQWVLFTSHRDARPWIGEIVAPDEPPVPEDNALAPGGRRIDATNPDYRGVFVFTNDLPVFSPGRARTGARRRPLPDPPRERHGGGGLLPPRRQPVHGRPHDDEMSAIVTTWRERTRALQSEEDVAHVLIFENRGAAVGTSNPHPHCQIYAGSLVYATMAREAEVGLRPPSANRAPAASRRGRPRGDGPRVISEGEHFFACVPWFAQYAYEVLVLPRQPATSLVDLDDDRCRSLGLVLRDVVRRYDALWGFRLPYVLAVHQAPVGDHPHYPFHLELHPPLRAPGLLKYLAGPEVGGGSMTERVRSGREGGGAPCHPRLTRPGACSAGSGDTSAPSSPAPAAWRCRRWRGRPWPTPSTPSTVWRTTRCWAGSRSTGPTSGWCPKGSTIRSSSARTRIGP